MKRYIFTFLFFFPILLIGQENGALTCADGIDNDGDGLIDCEDEDCQSLPNEGCSICPGAISFGDIVIEHQPGCDLEDSDDIDSVLGVSDNPVNVGGDLPEALFLGDGGFVKIGFTNNLLINSGDDDPDLWVFEVGTVVEASIIAVQPADNFTLGEVMTAGLMDDDGDGYFEVGTIAGATSSIDIDAVLPGYANAELSFDAVEIRDVAGDSDLCNGITPGSDIDAVCALFTQVVDCAGNVNGTFEIDECGECLDPDDPLFNDCSNCIEGNPGTIDGGGDICFGDTAMAFSNGDAQITNGTSLVYFLSFAEQPTSNADVLVQNETGLFEMPNGVATGDKIFIFAALVDDSGIIDFDPDCGLISSGIGVSWLSPIEFLVTNDCNTANGELSVYFEVTGGLPELDGSLYEVSNLADITLNENEGVIVNLGQFEGQVYTIEAMDGAGCTGVYVSEVVACVKNAISLTSFEGFVLEEGNLIEWETATEQDNDYFVLERSEGQNQWESIAQIEGAGNSSEAIHYVYFDKEGLDKTFYYRLKAVDFFGQYDFSSIISLERNTTTPTATIFPNPVIHTAQVTIDAVPRSTRLSIYDVAGNEVYREKIGRFETTAELALDFLPAGIYFIQLESEKLELLKFLKQG